MTITEVSKLYGLTPDTLRYYERIHLIPAVHRNPNGIRNYTQEDCNWIQFAKCMRSAGISIETLIEYVALFQQGDSTREYRKQMLVEEYEKLQYRVKEMKETMDRLESKIAHYDDTILQAENRLQGTIKEK